MVSGCSCFRKTTPSKLSCSWRSISFFNNSSTASRWAGVYALVALGYTMVYGIIELINFAHGDVYTLGTFFSLSIIALIPMSKFTAGYELWLIAFVVIVLAALLCGIVGVLIERLAYRRLRNAPRLAPLITAIGVSLILENIMQLWKGPSEVSFPQFLPDRIHTFRWRSRSTTTRCSSSSLASPA